MSDVPADLRYSTDHLWVRPGAEGLVRVGATDFADPDRNTWIIQEIGQACA